MTTSADPHALGRVSGCWRYPVKSLQGVEVGHLDLLPRGVDGDRSFGLIDVETGRLLSAKRTSVLLMAAADDEVITFPDGRAVGLREPEVHDVVSDWLGRPVRLVASDAAGEVSFEITLDPPNDDAEFYDIPAYAGSVLDSCAVHVIARATLDACAVARPDLDWDVRRFRPNVVLDVDIEPFGEHEWFGRTLEIGETALAVNGPMVRCAMPLRAQADGLEREPEIFQALSDLNTAFPNHLGLVCEVATTGRIHDGDPVTLA